MFTYREETTLTCSEDIHHVFHLVLKIHTIHSHHVLCSTLKMQFVAVRETMHMKEIYMAGSLSDKLFCLWEPFSEQQVKATWKPAADVTYCQNVSVIIAEEMLGPFTFFLSSV